MRCLQCHQGTPAGGHEKFPGPVLQNVSQYAETHRHGSQGPRQPGRGGRLRPARITQPDRAAVSDGDELGDVSAMGGRSRPTTVVSKHAERVDRAMPLLQSAAAVATGESDERRTQMGLSRLRNATSIRWPPDRHLSSHSYGQVTPCTGETRDRSI